MLGTRYSVFSLGIGLLRFATPRGEPQISNADLTAPHERSFVNGIYPEYVTQTTSARCSVIALSLGSSRKDCETEAGSSAVGIALFDYGVEQWHKWVRAHGRRATRGPRFARSNDVVRAEYLFTDHSWTRRSPTR
jgi:hypothetical protein